MRWGYTDGKRNGKKTAKNEDKDGFEFGKTQRMTMESNVGLNAPGVEGKNVKKTTYSIKSPATDGDWIDVNKEEYDKAAGYHLYYNNEYVSDIIERNLDKTVQSITKTASNIIDKGKNLSVNFFK